MVYHGTDTEFNEFKDIKELSRGFWFSPKEGVSKRFSNGTNIVKATFLNIRNPKDISNIKNGNELFNDIENNDGMYSEERVIVAFNPSQIKSATSNVGTFSNDNNDIRFSVEKEPAKLTGLVGATAAL